MATPTIRWAPPSTGRNKEGTAFPLHTHNERNIQDLPSFLPFGFFFTTTISPASIVGSRPGTGEGRRLLSFCPLFVFSHAQCSSRGRPGGSITTTKPTRAAISYIIYHQFRRGEIWELAEMEGGPPPWMRRLLPTTASYFPLASSSSSS
jgi:hypothetical protein